MQLFRASTTRKNVAYRVIFIEVARDKFDSIVKTIEQKMKQYSKKKIVIYCYSMQKS